MNNLTYNPWTDSYESAQTVELHLEIQELIHKRDDLTAKINVLSKRLELNQLADKISSSKIK